MQQKEKGAHQAAGAGRLRAKIAFWGDGHRARPGCLTGTEATAMVTEKALQMEHWWTQPAGYHATSASMDGAPLPHSHNERIRARACLPGKARVQS